MFMRGSMEQKSQHERVLIGHAAKVEWKVDAIIDNDSAKFACDLQKLLNDSASDGYHVSSFLTRATDNGLVVIHQRAFVEVSISEEAPASGTN